MTNPRRPLHIAAFERTMAARGDVTHEAEAAISDANRRLAIDHLTVGSRFPVQFAREMFKTFTDEQIAREIMEVRDIETSNVVNVENLVVEIKVLRETFPSW